MKEEGRLMADPKTQSNPTDDLRIAFTGVISSDTDRDIAQRSLPEEMQTQCGERSLSLLTVGTNYEPRPDVLQQHHRDRSTRLS